MANHYSTCAEWEERHQLKERTGRVTRPTTLPLLSYEEQGLVLEKDAYRQILVHQNSLILPATLGPLI